MGNSIDYTLVAAACLFGTCANDAFFQKSNRSQMSSEIIKSVERVEQQVRDLDYKVMVASDETSNIKNKVDNIKLECNEPQIYQENVRGKQQAEKFYVIDGKRVYVEIDGKPLY